MQVFIWPFFCLHDKTEHGAKSSRSYCSLTRHPISELSEQEFHARFYLPYSISIYLSNEEASSMIYFTKEQFAAGLCLPHFFLVKQFLHFSQIPLAFIHPNIIRILMGCSVLDTLYQLDLSLLEVLFVYTTKMSVKKRFSLSVHIPSLQFIIGLQDFNKGWAKGHVLVSCLWNRATEDLDKFFKFTQSLQIPSFECFHDLHISYFNLFMTSTNMCFVHARKNKRGHLVEWVEKSSFAYLNKLLAINQSKQSYSVLLIEKNLKAVLAWVKPFVIPLILRLAPSTLVSGKHFVLKDLPFYEVAHLVDAKARHACLDAQ